MNHRRRLFSSWHGIKQGGRHLFTNGIRWYASRDSCDTGKPRDKTTSEENNQVDLGGKGEKAPLWNAAVGLFCFFMGGGLGHGRLVVFASCSLFLCACLSVVYLLFLSGDHFSAS